MGQEGVGMSGTDEQLDGTTRLLFSIRLGRIKREHEALLQAIAADQPELLVLPASELANLPIGRETQFRFTELMNAAQRMAGRWSNLAHEYAHLAEQMQNVCDVNEAKAEMARESEADDVPPMVEHRRGSPREAF
jgi:hypothetical protein